MSVVQGGRFEHGFIAAGFTKALNVNRIAKGDISPSAVASRVSLAAIVGGTASKITGGKFANGAVTAALAQAVNAESANKRKAAQEGDYLNSRSDCPGDCGVAYDGNGNKMWVPKGALGDVASANAKDITLGEELTTPPALVFPTKSRHLT